MLTLKIIGAIGGHTDNILDEARNAIREKLLSEDAEGETEE